jgi:hypothetical protein
MPPRSIPSPYNGHRGRAAGQAHQYGKQLFVEVGVNVNNLSLASSNYGTNYSVMLQNVDKIVVQDYFGTNGSTPQYAGSIAKYLAGLGAGRGGFGVPGGRPSGRCNPAAPSLRYASRQRYSTLRLIWNSSCKALTLSPLSMRCATPSLNFRLKTRFFPDKFDLFPFNEKCP